MIIVGEKERQNHSISVRQRDAEPDKQDMGEMNIDEFIQMIHENGAPEMKRLLISNSASVLK